MQEPFLSSHGLSSKTRAKRLPGESREESPGGRSNDDALVAAARSARDIELKQEHPIEDISMRQKLAAHIQVQLGLLFSPMTSSED